MSTLFFFSSRRRHTRSLRDWSSDVCSSDLVEIARAADTTVVVGVPNLGDDIQAIKAGILEIADILVVNKADLAGSDRLVAELRAMLQLGDDREWPTPIQQTVATDGSGVGDLVDRI